jgi:DNA-binding response OmpR family regulator
MTAARSDFVALRIFVVEDHQDTLEALQIYLEQSGHIVLSASLKTHDRISQYYLTRNGILE